MGHILSPPGVPLYIEVFDRCSLRNASRLVSNDLRGSIMTINNLERIGISQTTRILILVVFTITVITGAETHGTNHRTVEDLTYSSASASAAAGAYASAGASSFTDVGGLPRVDINHERHKGIRSYSSGTDSSNQGGNRVKGCSKCKWEDDDYWEKEEEEEETEPEVRDDDDCDDGDDGQYREEYRHGDGDKSGLPSGVQKLGLGSSSGQVPFGGSGSSASAGNNAGSGASFKAMPIKQGYPGGGSSAPGYLGNKSPVSTADVYGLDQSSSRQSGQQSGQQSWNSGIETTSKPSWNQGYVGSKPESHGTASQPTVNWNASPGSLAHGVAPHQLGGGWNSKAETGFGCSGSYPPGSSCGQGASNTGPVKQAPIPIDTGNVQKQGSPNYSTNSIRGHDPQGSSVGCSDPHGNCGNTPFQQIGSTGEQGQHPNSGSPENSVSGSSYGLANGQAQYPNGVLSQNSPPGSPYRPNNGQGQYPISGFPQNQPGSSYATRPEQGQYPNNERPPPVASYGPSNIGLNNGISGNVENSGSTRYPGSFHNTHGVGSGTFSSTSAAFAGATSTIPVNHPSINVFEKEASLNAGPTGSPSGSTVYGTSNTPAYFGLKGVSSNPKNTLSPNHAYNKPNSELGPHPSILSNTKPSFNNGNAFQPTGTGAPAGLGSGRATPNKEDSKIFYINVNPVPGRPRGVKPAGEIKTPSHGGSGATEPAHQHALYEGTRSTTPTYKSTFYGGTGTTKPVYHASSYGGVESTTPTYKPSSYHGTGTIKPVYQPPSYDVVGTTKGAYQPPSYGGIGTAKPVYQPPSYGGIGTTTPVYQPPSYGNIGTTTPAYKSPSYSGIGTTKSVYHPSSYGGTGTTKPVYQAVPYGNTGTTNNKSAYQPLSYGTTSGTTRSPNFGGSQGVPSSHRGTNNYPVNQVSAGSQYTSNAVNCASSGQNCASGNGCDQSESSNYKPCDRQDASVNVEKTSGPLGASNASPNDHSQSLLPIFPADGIRSSSGNVDSPGVTSGCAYGANNCAPNSKRPSYVDKIENANKSPESVADGLYKWNPFLSGKVPDLAGSFPTTTSKPIGQGNPFLDDTVQGGPVVGFAGAGSQSHINPGISPVSSHGAPSGGKPTKPLGKDNPFLVDTGPLRGDIGSSNTGSSLPGGSDFQGIDKSDEITQSTKGNPFLGSQDEPPDSGIHHPYLSSSSGPSLAGSLGNAKHPSGTIRGSGSGGGIGIGSGEFRNSPGSNNGGSLSNPIYANPNSGSIPGSVDPGVNSGLANSGSWASSGAGNQAGSGAWSSSRASAYASSNANSWAGSGSFAVKG